MRGLAAILCFAAASASADPIGTVSVDNLDFGQVAVGDSLDLAVTIRSVGDVTLDGAVLSGCSAYTVVSGGGAYSLEPGQSLAVTVRFKPPANGNYGCVLTTSSCACSNVLLSGEGIGEPEDPAVCDVSPSSIDFGTMVQDSVASATFRIKNTGGSVLSGSVSESCANYTIPSGGGAYSLSAGDSVVVTVRFTAPGLDGDYPCTVSTGGALLKGLATCSDVTVSARVSTPMAICSVSPSSLSFGIVNPDSAVYRTFRIKNTGGVGSSLEGTISESCAPFSITAGAGDFTLAAGESVNVTVQFTSSAESTFACTIGTGLDCADVACTASTVEGSALLLAAEDFEYLGAFKFGSTGTSLGYGAGRGLGIMPNGDLVILGTDLTGYIAVATPATPSLTRDVGSMPQATTVQSYTDPTGGLWQTEGANSRWEDIVVLDDRIVFTSYSFYDRAYDGRGGIGFLDLSFGNPSGLFYVGDADAVAATLGSPGNSHGVWYPGKTCGQMQEVPAAYVEGGRTLAVGRSRDEFGEDCSAGPSLYLVDPDDLENAVVALCYDQIGQSGENVPGPHSRSDYSLTDQITDMAWIGSTVLFSENKCRYPSHYYQEGQSGELGDPGVCDENTGYTCGHAGDDEPGYVGRLTFYDAAELMAVAHGEIDNWAPEPYATLELTDDLIDASCSSGMAGMTWDAANGILYIMQTRKNGDGPICHAWSVTTP